ncbi:hypothetical protein Slin15195_G114170 [Septoria linicola]|uniref:Uncharacterized protein n=1 Tax=Septoria linicola TaxID=215465 RepID=A0A9Q9ER11_9PEZI|nr:hypothetical protein Slin14017_G112510 [Septoria linicola]USW58098.1 hypothetical protein Slin15195_G114170 [Septoria linicola]
MSDKIGACSTGGLGESKSGSYQVTSSGTNNQGNHYCARDYGSSAANGNSYHYSNSNGSYYYSNSNGSSYYNNGRGNATYTPPSGK